MIVALVMAAGRSERFGRDKLQLDLGGKPLWQWSVDTFIAHPAIDAVCVVSNSPSPLWWRGGQGVRSEGSPSPRRWFVLRGEGVRGRGFEEFRSMLDSKDAAPEQESHSPHPPASSPRSTNHLRGEGEPSDLTPCPPLHQSGEGEVLVLHAEGGETRQESVRKGLEAIRTALPGEDPIVLIHDAARPFLNADTVNRVIETATRIGAAGVGVPVVDTIRTDAEHHVLDRDRMRAMQTPQAARLSVLIRAHDEGPPNQTDDLALLDVIGVGYEIVEGNRRNFKVTTEEDYQMARALLDQPKETETRTGLGYDVHAFSQDPSRPLMLGGIHFPGEPGLEGHSDADALVHAVVDAILGAANLGDIGTHFPPADPQWLNAPSLVFLEKAGSLVTLEGWRIAHIDATVLAERPKIMVRREEISRAMASALAIEAHRISIKATTHERLGAIGRGEGIAAMAVATLSRIP